MKPKLWQRLVAILLAAMLVGSFLLVLTGCSSNDPLAEQFRAGDNKNYIAGDGTVTEFAIDQRPSVSTWGGITESGDYLDSTMLAGVPVVLNFWYAACAPCRAEAPDLASLHAEFEPQGVQFVGVNVRDTAATALAFDRNFGIEYPSILDAKTGGVALSFTGIVSPSAVPTTLVIDADGNVTSRILGRIDFSVLKTLISEVVVP